VNLPRRSEMGRDGIHRAVVARLPPDLFTALRTFTKIGRRHYFICYTTPIMDEEKRVSPRFLFSEPVAYAKSEVMVNGSVARNVSLSGMSLRTQEFVPMGIILELQIRFGQSPKVVWVKAQVVRVREVLSEDCFEIGLKFIKDEECIKAVGKYINECRLNQQRS